MGTQKKGIVPALMPAQQNCRGKQDSAERRCHSNSSITFGCGGFLLYCVLNPSAI